MKKHCNRRGFTMMEMLVVVAIVGVLMAVAFVAVAQHQRSLERLERDSIAREIFVAAQNHLTMAQGQGFLGLNAEDIYGNEADATKGTYYFAVGQSGHHFSSTGLPSTWLDLMLPFGAVDETVLTGSYIIYYHKDTATILDVFYCSNPGARYGYDLGNTNWSDLQKWLDPNSSDAYADDKNMARRRNFKDNSVIGWYGGAKAETLPQGEPLVEPEIEIINAEKLQVKVTDVNTTTAKNAEGYTLQLIIYGLDLDGKKTGAEKVITLKQTGGAVSDPRIGEPVVNSDTNVVYTITLDDITTANMHFADLASDTGVAFVPGQDIMVQAKVFNNNVLTNIALSTEKTTNSLFEKVEKITAAGEGGQNTLTASVNNIRHLENLEKSISNVTTDRTDNAAGLTYSLRGAIQTNDLSWTDFKTATGGDSVVIYKHLASDTETALTGEGCYMPVSPDYLTSYDGQEHSVKDIKVNTSGDAGMFGALPTGCSVSNLKLIDFDITSTSSTSTSGNAGALAGTLTQTSAPTVANVSNVVAYNSTKNTDIKIRASGTSGHAGGLIGQITGSYGKIEKSAAALIVESSGGDAGGLIGRTGGGTVTACYSGGHTIDAGTGAVVYSTENYNVTSLAENGNAGGLIGSFTGKTEIRYGYSTCSATGKNAGGFVGTGADERSVIEYCYATGLVKGTGKENVSVTVGATTTTISDVPTDGAFAYNLPSDMTINNCKYFEIINEREDAAIGYDYLTPLGKKGTNAGITALDASLATYNGFTGVQSDWESANPYDPKLMEYYRFKPAGASAYISKYNLKTVEQLMKLKDPTASLNPTGDTTNCFVATHYGDWPAPEIFILNKANG